MDGQRSLKKALLPPLRVLRRPGEGPLIAAHRGALKAAPENTFIAYEAALDAGAHMIELDVHPTRDGGLAVLHDVTTGRTTGHHALVQDMTLEELAQLDAGASFTPRIHGQRIPTLPQVLDWVGGMAYLNLDVRSFPFEPFYRTEWIADLLVDAVHSAGMTDQVVFQAPDHKLALELHQRDPNLLVGVTQHGRPIDPAAIALSAGAQLLSGDTAYLTTEMVDQLHSAGVALMTSVELRLPGRPQSEAESRAIAARLVELGVDIIVSDDIPQVVSSLRSRNHQAPSA
jgi:glycerophosphoryl diester phosphodiesterase